MPGNDVKGSYDTVADDYVTHIYEELRGKPLDRQLLDRLAHLAGPVGPLCDMGCGPGQIARYLHERGAKVFGIDLSPEMVKRARALNPEIEFSEDDMLALSVADSTFGGIAAFYALVNIARPQVTDALREMRRVLRPGGYLITSFHIGDETLHRDEWWGKSVSIDFFFFKTQEMVGYLEAAGLTLIDTIEREPYPEVEHPSRRAYLVARKL